MDIEISEFPLFLKKGLEELKEKIDHAESVIKKIEVHIGEIVIPSINELRYVSRHIIDSIFKKNETDKKNELLKANNHCKKAIFDASDAGIQYCFSKIRIFREHYTRIVVTDVIPDYLDDLKQVDEVRTFLLSNRKSAVNREQYCNDCLHYFEIIIQIVKKFDLAREELNKKALEHNKSIIKSRIIIGISAGALAVTLIIGIITILLMQPQ